FVREAMVRAGLPEDRITVVRYGVEVEPEPEASPAKRARNRFLFAGRLSPEKGVDVLVEAARRAPEIPILVAGAGPALDQLQAAAPPSVSCLGWVGQAELSALRERCLMTLQPSTCYDVSPFASIESAASGTGVIASRIGGLPEIVQDGVSGVLVEPGDPDSLARAMREVSADPGSA